MMDSKRITACAMFLGYYVISQFVSYYLFIAFMGMMVVFLSSKQYGFLCLFDFISKAGMHMKEMAPVATVYYKLVVFASSHGFTYWIDNRLKTDVLILTTYLVLIYVLLPVFCSLVLKKIGLFDRVPERFKI